MEKQHTYWVQCVQLGANDNGAITLFRMWQDSDSRYVEFGGDAYWMWEGNPYRDHGNGFCWAEALHDGLAGPHSTLLHSGHERFAVLPKHSDYAHVERMWKLANSGVHVPEGF